MSNHTSPTPASDRSTSTDAADNRNPVSPADAADNRNPVSPTDADIPTRDPRRFLVTASALFWGLQFAFLNPSIGLILVALYGATPGQVGVALAAYNISGFISTLVVPALADRSGNYLRPLMWCGIFTVALVSALAMSTTLTWAVVSLVALGGPAGVGLGLLFAYQRQAGASVGDLMRTRATFSLAWVAGPPVATLLIGLLGKRSILWAIALVALIGLGITRSLTVRQRRDVRTAPAANAGESMARVLRRPDVGWLLITFIALQAPIVTNASVLSLFVTEALGLDLVWGGVALAVAAGLEIPLFGVLAPLAQRFGPRTVLACGAMIGVAYYLSMALLVSGRVTLIALQVLNAVYVVVISGIGLTLFQEVIGRPGLASGIFMNTTRIGAIIAGPTIGLGAGGALGYAGVFLLCTALTGFGTALLIIDWLRRRARASGSTCARLGRPRRRPITSL